MNNKNVVKIETIGEMQYLGKNFSAFIEQKEKEGAFKDGILKIIPPDDFKPVEDETWHEKFSKSSLKIRKTLIQKYQTIEPGVFHANFVPTPKKKTVKKFYELANGQKNQPPINKTDHEVERIYWESIRGNVQYGTEIQKKIMNSKTFNLDSLGTVLDLVKHLKIDGVTNSYIYIAMFGSTFTIHVEDMDLYGINVILHGFGKFWYCVAPEHGYKLEKLLNEKIWPEVKTQYKDCPNWLRHKTCLIDPTVLEKHGIPVTRMIQQKNEMIIVAPYAYHYGFNLGWNVAEAINFGSPSWIEFGKRAKHCCDIAPRVFKMDPFVEKYQKHLYPLWIHDPCLDIKPHPFEEPTKRNRILEHGMKILGEYASKLMIENISSVKNQSQKPIPGPSNVFKRKASAAITKPDLIVKDVSNVISKQKLTSVSESKNQVSTCQDNPNEGVSDARDYNQNKDSNQGDVKKTINCEICESGNYSKITHLKKHMSNKHGARNKPGRPKVPNKGLGRKHYECAKFAGGVISCDAKFVKSSKLKEHIITVHGGIKCTICEKTFKVASKLNFHLLNVHDRNKFCPHCKMVFGAKCTLDAHIETVHEKKKHFCSLCDKAFSARKALRYHIKCVHEKQKPFSCAICMKKFTTRKAQRSHTENIHEKLRPHVCDKCTEAFAHKPALRNHIQREHEGNKPQYCCTQCELKFFQKESLQGHIAFVHEGKRLHMCPTCNSANFSTAKSLKRHISTVHEKKKTVFCPICGVSFTVGASLKIHIKAVHEEKKPYLCNICGKNFPTNVSLKHHVLGVHKKVPKKERKHMFETIKIDNGIYSGERGKLTE